MKKNLKAISVCSSAGIGELYLKEIGIDVIAANEILQNRADCYKYFFPDSHVIVGDIREKRIKNELYQQIINHKPKLFLATPPCQGLSSIGKNKKQEEFNNDKRNFLIFDILEIIDNSDFDYILIENVPRFLKMYFPYKNQFKLLEEILIDKYSKNYNIKIIILDAKDYGIAQTRPRAIIKIYKKDLKWDFPKKEKEVTLQDVISHLPSLEHGEKSNLKWHYARKHNERIVFSLKNTPTGKSAMQNKIHYPKKENGEKIKGFHNTYKRMDWNKPAHARTTFSGSISSHNNVHPGRLLDDGTYSDARVLTLLETFIVSGINDNITFPKNASETFIRTIIGESIPPTMLKKILKTI